MPIAYAASANTAQDIAGGTASELTKLIELVLGKIPLWIAAAILIFFSFVAAKMIRSIVENKMEERGIEEEHKEVQILGGRMTYIVVLTLGVTVALKMAGIDLTTIVAAVAFGIGFALKDLIMNFLAGVMVLLGRQFTIGDYIKVAGTFGKVMEIQSRVTIIQAIDGTKVIVPNAKLFSNVVTSYTSNPLRRIEVETSVDYRSDIANALKVCLMAAKKTKGLLAEPKPYVLVSEFGASEIVIKVRGWVESRSGWLKTKSRLLQNLMKAFNEYSIDFPYPITQLVYDKDLDHEEIMIEEKEDGSKVIEHAKTDTNVHVVETPAGETVSVQTVATSGVTEVPASSSIASAQSGTADIAPAQSEPAPVSASPAANEPLVPMAEKRPEL